MVRFLHQNSVLSVFAFVGFLHEAVHGRGSKFVAGSVCDVGSASTDRSTRTTSVGSTSHPSCSPSPPPSDHASGKDFGKFGGRGASTKTEGEGERGRPPTPPAPRSANAERGAGSGGRRSAYAFSAEQDGTAEKAYAERRTPEQDGVPRNTPAYVFPFASLETLFIPDGHAEVQGCAATGWGTTGFGTTGFGTTDSGMTGCDTTVFGTTGCGAAPGPIPVGPQLLARDGYPQRKQDTTIRPPLHPHDTSRPHGADKGYYDDFARRLEHLITKGTLVKDTNKTTRKGRKKTSAYCPKFSVERLTSDHSFQSELDALWQMFSIDGVSLRVGSMSLLKHMRGLDLTRWLDVLRYSPEVCGRAKALLEWVRFGALFANVVEFCPVLQGS